MLKRKKIINDIVSLLSRRVPKTLTSRQAIGHYAEKEAVRFLKNQGVKILAKNWRAGRDEIDIIIKDGKVLAFVEVRARAEKALVSGYHSVNAKKKQALLRVCKAYLMELYPPPKHFRFDVVEVRLGPDKKITNIYYYQNISLFPKYFLASSI